MKRETANQDALSNQKEVEEGMEKNLHMRADVKHSLEYGPVT